MFVFVVFGVISKGGWEFVYFGLVYFLVYIFLEVFEDDGELRVGKAVKRGG